MQMNSGLPQGLGDFSTADLSKFRQYAKETFKGYVKFNFDYLDYIKSTSRFYSIDLPLSINEFPIKLESAPIFWVTNIPIISKTEEYFEKLSKSKGKNSNYSELKKLYTKWLTQKNERDKQFYTFSAINLLEKDLDKNHILKKVLHAVLLGFNNPVISQEKAINLLNDALLILDQNPDLGENISNELKYYITLYKGLIYFRNKDFIEAINQFEDANIIKHSGISATYFNALTKVKLNDNEEAANQILHIVEYDKERFSFAIKYRSLNLLDFFIKNAVIYNVFSEAAFSPLATELEQMIDFNYEYETSFLNQILINIDSLASFKLSELYTEQISQNLDFTKKISIQYQENQNKVISNVSYLITKYFNSILDLIVLSAQKKHDEEIDSKVLVYDIQIKESKKRIELTNGEIEKGAKEIEKRLETSLKAVEYELEGYVGNLEFKLKHLDENPKYNPADTFKNSMIYNGIIAMVVFIITGFSGGFLNNLNNYNDFSLILTSTIFAGVKWGLLTYIVGTLVSLFSSASTMWERATQKQRLIKQMTYMKNVGERNRKQFKQEAERQLALNSKKMKAKIKKLEEEIAEFENDKELHKQELKDGITNEIINLRTRLQGLYI